jgi:hypothetical protein
MTQQTSTKVTLSEIAALEHQLDDVPAQRTTVVSKRRAIAMLGPKLYEMRAKGYLWSDIAGWLTERGIAVSAAVLQRYLRDGGAEEKRTGRARGVPRAATRTVTSPRGLSTAAGEGKTTPDPPVGDSGNDLTSPPTSPTAVRGQFVTSVRAGFTPRPDTKDL